MASWVVTAESPRAAAAIVARARAAGLRAHAGMIPTEHYSFSPQELQSIHSQLRRNASVPWSPPSIGLPSLVAGNGEAPCFTMLGLVLSGLGGLAVGGLLGVLGGWALANAMQIGTAVAPAAGAMLSKLPFAAAV